MEISVTTDNLKETTGLMYNSSVYANTKSRDDMISDIILFLNSYKVFIVGPPRNSFPRIETAHAGHLDHRIYRNISWLPVLPEELRHAGNSSTPISPPGHTL